MIVCAGEALIDMLPRKSERGEEAFAPYPGGAVFNTAIALGRLGVPTGFVSGLSTDLFGIQLEAALRDASVQTDHAIRSPNPTTLAFVRLTNGQASYTFYDENTAGRMLLAEEMPELPPSVRAAFFGGISLMVEPCGSAYEALLTRLAPTRAVMLDPNIRPSFIADAGAYRARVKRLMALTDIVKVSDEDLAWLMGAGDTAELAHDLLTQGPSLICVTEGADGVVGYHSGDAVRVPAERVEVVDTVGAGDTFNAGLLAALFERGKLTKADLRSIDDESVAEALSYGAKAAAITVSRAGANPPWRTEM